MISQSVRPNGHDTHSTLGIAEAECPYCGAPLSRAEFKTIQARMTSEAEARIGKALEVEKARFAREQKQAEAKAKAEVESARREAGKVGEAKLKELRKNMETVAQAAREAVEKKMAEAISAEKVQHFVEKTKLTEQLAEMQRRLERKTAAELGEPAEVDLFATLTKAFPGDQISRVGKGEKGTDVVVEVIEDGVLIPVGKIVVESKNHAKWSNRFTTKLRADQIAAGADFGILSTSVLPAGAQPLHLQDGVILTRPAIVPMLVRLLRKQIVDTHRLKLSVEARDEKAEKLLAYMVSPACTELLDGIIKAIEDLREIDRAEKAAHQKVWVKRESMEATIIAIQDQFAETVHQIVRGHDE